MEWCPYCRQWVEPVKGNWDLALGTLVGGLPGLIAGGAYHVFKGSRCPICNNPIERTRIQQPSPPIMNLPRKPAAVYPPEYPPTPPSEFFRPFVGPRQPCPHCRNDLFWEPHIGQWYCPHCRVLPFQRLPPYANF